MASSNEDALCSALLKQIPMVRDRLKGRIPGYLAPVVSVEDILQSAWLGIFSDPPSASIYDGPNFVAWVWRIVECRLIDSVRKAQTMRRGRGKAHMPNRPGPNDSYVDLLAKIAGPGRTPSSEEALEEAIGALRLALCALPDACRDAVQIRHLDGRSRAETAEEMGTTSAAVNGLLVRGLRLLRRRLGDDTQYFTNARGNGVGGVAVVRSK